MLRTSIFFLFIILSCRPSSTGTNKSDVLNTNSSFLSSLDLRDLEGKKIEVNRFENRILILNLWATWCGPCIREMPDLERMQSELSNEFILLLASDEEVERVQSFVKNTTHELEFISIGNSLESLGVYALPSTLIVGKDGELIETLVGARKWDSPEEIIKINNFLK